VSYYQGCRINDCRTNEVRLYSQRVNAKQENLGVVVKTLVETLAFASLDGDNGKRRFCLQNRSYLS
jgi:hypothetical protein